MGRVGSRCLRNIRAIADSDTVSAQARAHIRTAILAIVAQVRLEVDHIQLAASGPDPEWALVLLAELALRGFPSLLRTLDRELAPLRRVAC
jgi:hypothetical protein